MQPVSTTPGKEFFFSSMLEEIVDIRNVQKAFRQVTANKGAGVMVCRPMNFVTT